MKIRTDVPKNIRQLINKDGICQTCKTAPIKIDSELRLILVCPLCAERMIENQI